jgi:uncharacterized protein with NAD-binding domain and iron-sulfur cluster
MGFYENAFRLIRECYAELNRNPARVRIANWRDAFSPAPFIGMSDRSHVSFITYFPPAEGLPGDSLSEHDPFAAASYMARAANALRAMMVAASEQSGERPIRPEDRLHSSNFGMSSDADQAASLESTVTRLLKLGGLATLAGLIEGAELLQLIFARRVPYVGNFIERLLETMAITARHQIGLIVANDPILRSMWLGIDLSLTSMLGIVRFGLMSDPRGFDAINDYDFREWLRMNGAASETLDSPLLRAFYDLAFAYENGDYNLPRQGAGVGLRAGMRMLFSYRGAMVWKMNAGMGDIVFAPLYEVLKRRGVRFEFFHRLENIRLADPQTLRPGERQYVAALEFDVQAAVPGGTEYQPLIDVDGLPCWPAQPDYDQLVNGETIASEDWRLESQWDRRKITSKTLRVIDDFDFVVLAVGGGTIPYVCQEMIKTNPRWSEMVTRVKTVETQALQLWLSEDLERLGWAHPPVVLCGFVQPFESFADMRHLIPEEKWPVSPGAIAYFLSTLKESPQPQRNGHDYALARNVEVRSNAIRFLNQDVVRLWPKAVSPDGQFRWELLMDPAERPGANHTKAGEIRVDSQFWRANVEPGERYVISVPGSQKYRISPLDNTYDNLTVAGDWTSNGMDCGCVEAAVMSGRLAAHALSSLPALEDIVGYDHP